MLRGLVEIYTDTHWGYVCANHWTLTEAQVVCRQLGFEGALTQQLKHVALYCDSCLIT